MACDTWADINLNGVPIDPATGQPLAAAGWDPAQEYGIDPAGFEGDAAIDAGISAGGLGAPGQTFAPHPVEIDPEAVDTTEAADGSILIRPSQPRRRRRRSRSAAASCRGGATGRGARGAPAGYAPTGTAPAPRSRRSLSRAETAR